MKYDVYVARLGERIGTYRVMVWWSEGKGPLEDLGLDVRIILKCILKKWDCSGLGYGQVTRACESGDDHSCCI